MNYPDDPIYTKNVIEMLTVANDFCIFIESDESTENENIINYLQKVLPLLYLKGSLLNKVAVDDESANERFVIEEQWKNVFDVFKKKFEIYNVFFYVDEPFTDSELVIEGNLAEDIADIYQDLKDFILLYQKNFYSSKQNAVNSCRILFYERWGIKSIRILGRIHSILKPEAESNLQIY